MKKLAYLVAAGALLLTAETHAQQPRNSTRLLPSAARSSKPADQLPDTTTSLTQMTPEMWFYQQEMRRYEDPRAAVRRKAEYRAAQRQRRIAAMDWYGYSNSRPQANPTPFAGGPYAAGWVSNNYRYPLQWSGGGRTVVYGARSFAPGAFWAR